jgi:mycothiol synthase
VSFTLRPATWDDLPHIADTMRAVDLHDWGAEVGEENDIRDDWDLPTFDLARDTIVAVGDAGEIAGYASVIRESDSPEVFSIGFVHPGWRGRGIGSALVERVEARAREVVGGRDGGLVRALASPTASDRNLFEGLGFRLARSMETMIASLEHEPPEIDPEEVTIRPFEHGDEGRVHAVLMAAFARHYGFVDESFEEWRAHTLDAPRTDTGLVFVADAGGAMVGVTIGHVRLGIGWVAELGVLEEWRRRGIGAALTTRLMREFRNRGQTKIGLNVDPQNETGAIRLYERLGFTRDKRMDFYELNL